jgi:O-antigen/teichoic acid export membrane protein
MGLSFVLSVLFARLLGVAGYGTYSYTMAWIHLLAVPALFGLDRLLIREVAAYRAREQWHLLKGLLQWSNRMVLPVSVVLAMIAAGIVWLFTDRMRFETSTALWTGLFILPLFSLIAVKQAAMQGLSRVVYALLPDMFVRPMILAVSLGCAYLILRDGLNVQLALGLNIGAATCALFFAIYLLRKMVPNIAKDVAPVYQRRLWVRSALPMMLISGMHVINHRIDEIMLGTIKNAEAVGLYSVANRGAQLILVIQAAVNVALGPAIAGLHASGKTGQLQQLMTKASRGVLVISMTVAFGLLLFGDAFLSIFGSEFVQGNRAFTILIFGCVINAAAGSVSLLLVMTGYERDAAKGIGFGVLLSIVLNAALIPKWGVEGAATATSIGMSARNIMMAVLVYTRLGIHSTALARIGSRREA